MDFLPVIYLTYMFIALYMLALFLMIYFRNTDRFFDYPEPRTKPPVSFIVPAYNEGETIEGCIQCIFESYDNISEVIVVNDCSTDETRRIVEGLMKKYPKIRLINNSVNCGNAAGSQNIGLKYAQAEFVAVVDADSYPAKDSITKMIGFMEDERVGAVTCPVLARNTNTFFAKLQAIEYKMISFSRKLLEFIDAIYVTPGPLALYRKKALDDIGGFDEKNMTQDIEATWHLAYKGWERKMSLATYVTSSVPLNLKAWFIQRRRWNIGGLQCIQKYKKHLGKKGMLGWFIVPFFIINLFLGLIGLGIFSYVLGKRIFSQFLLTRYSIATSTPILTIEEFYITPSFLNYLGIILFFAGLVFTLAVLAILKDRVFRRENILNIPFYLTIYLVLYPLIMLNAIWYYYKGIYVWR
jgi:cellulose synthase/poly-beta-1,6-N-acetylglucosamine synthase-like glycosyltransferase